MSDQKIGVDFEAGSSPNTAPISKENPAFVFISHRSEDKAIATTLKTALETLSLEKLKVDISEKMEGGEDWRKWIKKNVQKANALIFLHTDEEADLDWCLYEIGLFRGKPNTNRRRRVFCIKEPSIDQLPDQIADIQSNNADDDGIAKLFKDLISDSSVFGVPLNPDVTLHPKLYGDTISAFERYAGMIKRQFVLLVRSRQIVQLLTIRLAELSGEHSTTDGHGINEFDYDKAEISGKDALRLLRLPERGCSWRHMYNEFKSRGQIAWLDVLARRIEAMRSSVGGDEPAIALPRLELDGKMLNPLISRYEMFQLRHQGEAAKNVLSALTVALVPAPKGLHDVRGLLDNKSIDLFAPASIVQVNWKKRSHKFEYDPTDMDGLPIIRESNAEFARLYNIKAGPGGVVGGSVLTADQLFKFVEDYVDPEHMDALKEDQERLANSIILKFNDDRAKVPLQFNSHHPHFGEKVFLPYVICKQQVGDHTGPHQTLFFICYIEDFIPIE